MALSKEQKELRLAELRSFIQLHKDDKGPLMPIMQKAQELFGYLSLETQTVIAEGLGIPVSEVYGVATFYAQFSLEPKGQYVIGVCTGTACYVKGAAAVLEEAGIRTACPWKSRWKNSSASPRGAPARTECSPFRIPAAWAAAVLLP